MSEPPFHFESSLLEGVRYEVRSFRGREAVSVPYRFDVALRTQGLPAEAARQLLGERGILRFGSVERRTIHGVIRRVRVRRVDNLPEAYDVDVVLAPGLHALGLSRTSRIFQDRSSTDIAREILDATQLRTRAALHRDLVVRGYCVQHQETHLAFLQRILAEDAISYWFDHASTTETLVFVDDVAMLETLTGDPNIPYRPADGLVETSEAVTRLRSVERTVSSSVLMRGFDWTRPSFEVRGTASHGEDPTLLHAIGRVYDHHPEFEGAPITDAVAALELNQARRRSALIEGVSNAARFEAGRRFAMEEVPDATGGDYVLLEVNHSGRASPNAGERSYENRFVALTPGHALVPPRRPRRIQQNLETATVVGPEGSEIYTDEHGRIKVRFHWDIDDRPGASASCWIRAAQPWSGSSYGFQFIPRVGMEVLVLFTGGDTDQPLVVGAVPNVANPLPFPLPRDETKSGVRTRSTPKSAGYNELSFDDAVGRELVHLRAERDLEEIVQRDRRASVGAAEFLSVGANRTDVVGGDAVSTVGSNRTSVIGAHESLLVTGNYSVSVTGSATRDVSGGSTESIGAGRTVHLRGADGLSVGAARTVTVTGDDVASVGGDHASITGEHTIVASGGPDAGPSLRLVGTLGVDVTSSGDLHFRGSSITLTAGKTVLELHDDGARLTTKKFEVIAEDKVALQGSTAIVTLDGDALVLGSNATLESSGAKIALTSDATIEGSKIALKSGSGDTKQAPTSDDDQPTTPPNLTFGVTIHAYAAGKDNGAIVFRDTDGNEVQRIDASSATRNAGSIYYFEVDPSSLPAQPLEVVWVTPHDERVLAACGLLGELRDKIHAGRTREAAATTMTGPPRKKEAAAGPRRATAPASRGLPVAMPEELQGRLHALGALPGVEHGDEGDAK